jgi:two-component system response regulator DevR
MGSGATTTGCDAHRPGRAGVARERAVRVLIAEDSNDLRRVLAMLIDGEPDLECVGTVAAPERLLASTRELEPDVLVLDLVLEGGSALHLIRALRDAHPRLRIILHSGYVGSVVLAEARRRGATACVAKGADYRDLMDAIRGFTTPGDDASAPT